MHQGGGVVEAGRPSVAQANGYLIVYNTQSCQCHAIPCRSDGVAILQGEGISHIWNNDTIIINLTRENGWLALGPIDIMW
jgi:hypothetical protein